MQEDETKFDNHSSTYPLFLEYHDYYILAREVRRNNLHVTLDTIETTCEVINTDNRGPITMCLLPENKLFIGYEEGQFSIIQTENVRKESFESVEKSSNFSAQSIPWHATPIDADRLAFGGNGSLHTFSQANRHLECATNSSTLSEYGRKNLHCYGSRFLLYCAQENIHVFDTETAHDIKLVKHTGARCMEPLDKRRLATGGDDKHIRIWNLETRTEIASFICDDWVWSLMYYGNELLYSSASGAVSCTNITTHQRKKGLKEPFWVRTLTYLSDKLVLVTGDSGIMFVFDVNNFDAKLINFQKLEDKHTADVLGVELLPDGRLITGSRDFTIRVWKFANPKTPSTCFKRLHTCHWLC
jgi:WD40 repeat protein